VYIVSKIGDIKNSRIASLLRKEGVKPPTKSDCTVAIGGTEISDLSDAFLAISYYMFFFYYFPSADG